MNIIDISTKFPPPCLHWQVDETDNLHETFTFGRNFFTVDYDGNRVKLYWLNIDNGVRAFRCVPEYLVSAVRSWLMNYRAIPLKDFINKMF